jgi:hypothetical protein
MSGGGADSLTEYPELYPVGHFFESKATEDRHLMDIKKTETRRTLELRLKVRAAQRPILYGSGEWRCLWGRRPQVGMWEQG